MILLSSRITVITKFFLPVIIVGILGGITIITWTEPSITDDVTIDSTKNLHTYLSVIRILTTSTFVVVLATWFLLFSAVKRLEWDQEDIVYISNYFKTFKYPLPLVESITITNMLLYKQATIEFTKKTALGKKVNCIVSGKNSEDFSKLKTSISNQSTQD